VVRLQLRPPAHTIKRVEEICALVLEKADEAKDMLASSPARPHQMLDQVVFAIKNDADAPAFADRENAGLRVTRPPTISASM
jgi:hypothetical protein